jgi:hypothetical protein
MILKFLYKKKFFFFKKSKADLERQRAKGPNHNPTKVAFIENQIRQYEQQLNENKRRLDIIEVNRKRVYFKLKINLFEFSHQLMFHLLNQVSVLKILAIN